MTTPTAPSSEKTAPSSDKLPGPSVPKRWPLWLALVLQLGAVVVVAAGLVVAKVTAESLDGDAVRSIAIATGVVGFAGAVALGIASLAGDPKQAATMVLAGMLVRLFVPLAALFLVTQRWPELNEAGFREQVLILYLAALVVETYAAIRVTGMPRPRFASK